MNYGSNYAPVSFYKDAEGFVRFRGLLKSGTTKYPFVLPSGYRPAYNHEMVVSCSGSIPCEVIFMPSG